MMIIYRQIQSMLEQLKNNLTNSQQPELKNIIFSLTHIIDLIDSKENEIKTELIKACEFGMGFSKDANVLLWNVAVVLDEISDKNYWTCETRQNLRRRANELRTKSELEAKALRKAREQDESC